MTPNDNEASRAAAPEPKGPDDVADARTIFLERHLSQVIASAMQKAQAGWEASLDRKLDRALGGNVPQRVEALERYNVTRELRSFLIGFAGAMMGGGIVYFGLLLSGSIRVVI